MRKIALSVAALALTAGSALAADLPSRKGPPLLPPPPPPPLWTGFYVGLNAGYTWSNNGSSIIATGIAPGFFPQLGVGASANLGNNTSGFIGGGQIGYNYQFYNNFLVGLEADIQGVAGSGGNSVATTAIPHPVAGSIVTSFSTSSSLDYIGTVRGRLGWLFTPTLLVYGTGGFAYGGVTYNAGVFQNLTAFPATTPGLAASVFADTRTGWTAGGGVEWMFWPNWSAKVEYLYYDLGSITPPVSAFSFPNIATTVGTTSFGSPSFRGNIVRAGVNYHFNWGAPAPIVAKY